jgi:Tol biopolymer transport system component
VDYQGGGGNPILYRNWIVDADGTSLIQLGTEESSDRYSDRPSISDDATRVVYTDRNTPGGLYAINADGSGKRRLPSLLFFALPAFANISGDGSRIAFSFTGELATGPPCASVADQIGTIDWNGNGLTRISCNTNYVEPPSIDDTGSWVVYEGDGATYRGAFNGTSVEISPCAEPVLSGDNSTIVVRCTGDAYSGNNPDEGYELFALDNVGANPVQLTVTVSSVVTSSDVSSDGTQTVFSSTAELIGPNTSGADLYLYDATAGSLVRLFDAADGEFVYGARIEGAGARAWFIYRGDPLGSNTSGGAQLFRIDTDGTGLIQVTPDELSFVDEVDISDDGSIVVFRSSGDWAGLNPSLEPSIWKINPGGGGLQKIVGSANYPRISGDGNWLFYLDLTDQGLKRIHPDGSGFEALTTEDSGPGSPDSTGSRVVFESSADPSATEVVWMDTATLVTTSLSSCGVNGFCSTLQAVISGDGQFASAVLRDDGFENSDLFDVITYKLSDGSRVRSSGLSTCEPLDVSISANGEVLAIRASGDCDGSNDDRRWGLFRVDAGATSSPLPSGGSGPTVVEWEAEAGGLRYDVVRGDLAALAFDGIGGVDLGPVICVEDESIDTNTIGDEDVLLPVPGQGFFYLHRATQGVDDGPGVYGAASDGSQRLAAAGDCPG